MSAEKVEQKLDLHGSC